MYAKTENPLQTKMKLAVAAAMCSILTVSSAVAMVVNQAGLA